MHLVHLCANAPLFICVVLNVNMACSKILVCMSVYEQCIAQGQCIEVIEVLDVEMVIINCCFSLAWIDVFQNHFWLHQGRMSNSVSCPSNWWPCQSVSKLFNRLVWCTWIHILSCLKPQAIYTLNLAYLQIRSQQGYFLPSHRFFVPLFGSCCSTLNSQKNTRVHQFVLNLAVLSSVNLFALPSIDKSVNIVFYKYIILVYHFFYVTFVMICYNTVICYAFVLIYSCWGLRFCV